MWTSNNWFSYRRDALEEALENVAEGMVHTVDWDGPSQVKVTNKTPNEVEVRRIDAKGNVLSGDDHVMIYSKGEPEFHRIMSDEGNNDDHEAWREKRAASLQGRSYHESANLDEVSMKTLSSYSIKASDSAKHRKLPIKKVDNRYAGVKMADEKIRKSDGKDSTAKIGVSKRVEESYLTEATTTHGPYTFTAGIKVKRSEGNPSHVIAHTRKMNKLGVPVHDEDDYGDTVAVRVENTNTGASTLHHVYQRGMSSWKDESTKRLVSVRPVGPSRPETLEHNQVIADYLSGKRYKP